MQDHQKLLRPLHAVVRRVRIQRALDIATTLSLAAFGALAVVVAVMKVGALDVAHARVWIGVALSLPLVGMLLGFFLPVRELHAAQLLDRSHRLSDRVANALQFVRVPAKERTPFMQASIDDALQRAGALEPKRAMPLRIPRDVGASLGLLVAALALSFVEVRHRVRVPIATRINPLIMHPDDIDAFQSGLDALMQREELDEGVRDSARQFNQLMEDLAAQRLDRTEALRRLQQVSESIDGARRADADQMRESLQQLSQDLQRAQSTEAAAQALSEGDAARASEEMRRLAEMLRENPPSRAELERLREAMRRAAQRAGADSRPELERQRQEMNRLLQRQREQKTPQTESERRLLERRRRDLERLERQAQAEEAQRRQLERLQRDMQQAAEHLNNQADREEAADDIERAAEELNRAAREQMSEEERQRLQEQLSELREMIRRQREQQAQNGQGQGQQQQGQGQGQGQSRMDRFVLRANGQGQQARIMGPGQQGQGQGQQGQGQGQGQQGQGQGQQGQGQGQGGQQGQAGQGAGGQGQGQGQGQGPMVLQLGGQGGNATLEIPGMGQGRSQQGQGQGGNGPPGPGAGQGHNEANLDDPTHLQSNRQNTRVEGEASGQGPTRSEVILGAAERGFANRAYERVYVDYEHHAEEVLEQDEIPGGYRFYVRRYFQLIRPREGQ